MLIESTHDVAIAWSLNDVPTYIYHEVERNDVVWKRNEEKGRGRLLWFLDECIGFLIIEVGQIFSNCLSSISTFFILIFYTTTQQVQPFSITSKPR